MSEEILREFAAVQRQINRMSKRIGEREEKIRSSAESQISELQEFVVDSLYEEIVSEYS